MKLIGSGYWYNVFDIGNGRVRKVEKNLIQKAWRSGFFEGFKPTVFQQLTKGSSEILMNYKRLESQADVSLLGSPKFLNGINYEQNKVRILGNVLKQSSDEEGKRLIDKYIESILECWRNGFDEKIHNLTINNGIDDSGRIILIDFNEITFFKENVLSDIETKNWINSWSLTQLNPNIRDYYLRRMEERITPDSLNKNWRGV